MSDATQSELLEDWCYIDALGRPRRRKSPMKRLVPRILVTASGCHEFQGARNDMNYGQIGVKSRLMYTHRVMWIAHHGPIPDGLLVLHHCDNPPCCNLDHLFLGTKRDNAIDMARKGRWRNQFSA